MRLRSHLCLESQWSSDNNSHNLTEEQTSGGQSRVAERSPVLHAPPPEASPKTKKKNIHIALIIFTLLFGDEKHQTVATLRSANFDFEQTYCKDP